MTCKSDNVVYAIFCTTCPPVNLYRRDRTLLARALPGTPSPRHWSTIRQPSDPLSTYASMKISSKGHSERDIKISVLGTGSGGSRARKRREQVNYHSKKNLSKCKMHTNIQTAHLSWNSVPQCLLLLSLKIKCCYDRFLLFSSWTHKYFTWSGMSLNISPYGVKGSVKKLSTNHSDVHCATYASEYIQFIET